MSGALTVLLPVRSTFGGEWQGYAAAIGLGLSPGQQRTSTWHHRRCIMDTDGQSQPRYDCGVTQAPASQSQASYDCDVTDSLGQWRAEDSELEGQ